MASYVLMRITCKKWGEGVQIACKLAYVLNGRPLSAELKRRSFLELLVTGMVTISSIPVPVNGWFDQNLCRGPDHDLSFAIVGPFFPHMLP